MGTGALALLAGVLLALALPEAFPAVPLESLAPPVRIAAALRALVACLVVGLVVGLLVPPRSRPARAGRSRAARPAGLCLLGAALATLTLAGELARRGTLEPSGATLELTGRVVDVPAVRGEATTFTLAVDVPVAPVAPVAPADPAAGTVSAPPGTRVRLTSRHPGTVVRAGERWRFAVRLGPLDGLANGGGFDRERWMLGARLHARGTVRPEPAPVRLDDGAGALAGALAAMRQRARERMAGLDAADARLPFVEALALGLGDGVPEADRALLRATGTAHLLAISGLHVGLVAAAVAGLAGLAGRAWLAFAAARGAASRLDPAVPATLAAAAAALAYTLAAGAGLPTRRALAMLLAVGLARLLHRRLGRTDGLAAALLAVLLVDPLAPFAPGAWLSFGAVAAVLWLHGARRLPRSRVAAALRTHALLGVALLPASAWFFGEAALVAPLANLFAVPLATLVIVPASLLAALLAGPMPAAAGLALGVAQAAVGAMLGTLRRLDAFAGGDGTPFALGLPGPVALVLVLVAIAVASLPGRRTLLPLVPLLLLPAALHVARGRPVAPLEVHVLDVGQGLAVLLMTPGATVLYDTGGRYADTTMLERVVLPHLHSLGRRRLDALVVSHADSDHSAGLAAARARFPALAVFASDVPAAEEALSGGDGPAVRPCVAGQGFGYDGVRFDALHPAGTDPGSENDRSCVLLVHLGAARVLLPGDIEAGAEARLAARAGAPFPVDLLLVPHHGSRTSSTAAFVAAWPATDVVHAAGLGNAFGFPHASVRMRYKTAGARQHVTGTGGALVFRFDADGALGPPRRWRREGRVRELEGVPRDFRR